MLGSNLNGEYIIDLSSADKCCLAIIYTQACTFYIKVIYFTLQYSLAFGLESELRAYKDKYFLLPFTNIINDLP